MTHTASPARIEVPAVQRFDQSGRPGRWNNEELDSRFQERLFSYRNEPLEEVEEQELKPRHEKIENVLRRGQRAMSPRAFEAMLEETEALIIDTRDAQSFAHGFIPGSINIGPDEMLEAMEPGVRRELLIIADTGREKEAIVRLAKVGLDYIFGYLLGGIESWKEAGKAVGTAIAMAAVGSEAFAPRLAA